MSEFKIGDRVKYTGKSKTFSEKALIGATGVIIGMSTTFLARVKWNEDYFNNKYIGAKYTENLELLPKTFEVGKRYNNKISGFKNILCVFSDEDGGLLEFNDGSRCWWLNSQYDSFIEVKPEDWRCLHYSNNIATLGGESFLSKEEVEKKFSSSPNFIKAVRVDA